jgi:hypothetical protein
VALLAVTVARGGGHDASDHDFPLQCHSATGTASGTVLKCQCQPECDSVTASGPWHFGELNERGILPPDHPPTMESPLLAVEEPAAPVATTAARRYLTPVGAALALAALAAVFFYPSASAPSAAPNMIAPNLKADQDDEETHAPNALAPVTYRSLAEVAAAVPGAIVGGTNPLVFIGLGDWGRCGSPTNNPVTRATRCTVQRRMVPAMESWAASLKATNPNLFLMSVGDNCASPKPKSVRWLQK